MYYENDQTKAKKNLLIIGLDPEQAELEEQIEQERIQSLTEELSIKRTSTYIIGSKVKVQVDRYEPNMNNLAKEHLVRLSKIPDPKPDYLYINPIATVRCEAPSQEFFKQAQLRQAEWCRRFKQCIGRWSTRRVSNWVDCDGKLTRAEKYARRAMQFLGIMYVQCSPIDISEWGKHKALGASMHKPIPFLLPSPEAVRAGRVNWEAYCKQFGP